ncbi:hypothetical protein EDD11_004589 [Mortierella claussenii]|nr:hypothetical protein EDD11_004589 [Mortierella claussenii]
MRKRRASRRIGQLQRFLPTFMDQEKTEKYFQKQGSSTTLVGADAPGKDVSPPSNVHHRTRSAPIVFTKGVTDHRSRQLERDESLGQFQQISLVSEETVLEKEDSEPRRSLSGRSARVRAATVATPAPAPVRSSLHRSVSLNKNGHQGPISSRADPMEAEGEDIAHLGKFAEGESLVAPNRFSTLLNFGPPTTEYDNNSNRFSAISIVGVDPDFDPTRFSSASIMFDAKRISNMSTMSSDDTSSTTSTEEFRNNLPPHQQQPSFHSHYNSPIDRSHEATNMAYFGDKQELDEDEDIQQGYASLQQHSRQDFYPPLPQNSAMPVHLPMQMPMPMPVPSPTPDPATLAATASSLAHTPRRAGVPLPPRIRLSRPHGGQEISLATDHMEMEKENHPC